MKRLVMVLIVVLLAVNVVPARAQDDDCRALMGQVDTLIGQALAALDDGDVATAQSLLGAAQTLAGLCLDETETTATPAAVEPVEVSFLMVRGGTLTLTQPPGWVVFNPHAEGEPIEGLFLFSSAEARDAAMSPDGDLPPGAIVVRLTLIPPWAIEGDYTGIAALAQQAADEMGFTQVGPITETVFNERAAAFVALYDTEQDQRIQVVLIDGDDRFVMLMGMAAEADAARLEQATLTIAESIELEVEASG